ncbi:PKD repeat protein [Saonia flava]|uniref:PKD repeat protein n=1 Tax=Saonia flava TaxID=523696 RepID=A0A846R1M3_9FLAO|nr:PKD domain-containing protein [Saonia flava]NJB72862.1 PKD repeat protein [Saonia flava]
MKKIYAVCLGIFLLYSCSKGDTIPETGDPDTESETDPKTDPKIALKACFTVNQTNFEVGESLIITSCSEGTIKSYHYDMGNGNVSLKENPEFVLEEEGDFSILLTITDEEEKTDTFSKSISVSQPVEANYIFPDIAMGFKGFPLETGLTPDNKIYYMELTEDLLGVGGSKFNYRELDESYNISTSQYILDKQFNTQSAFVNFLANGNVNIHLSRTLPDFYGTHEITFDNAWSFINGLNSSSKHSYGYVPDGADFLYFGTQVEDGIYKTAVERRNGNGDAYEIHLNNFGSADAFIGDMIKTSTGFAAFGGVFTKNATAPQVTGYRPLLVFFDTVFNVTSHVVFENSVLDTKITSINDLNGNYHLVEMSNGNIAMYGNGELTITNSSGTMISSSYFEETTNNQAMISLGASFIISTNNFLRKFDADGNQTKELKYNGNYLPEFVQKDGQLFFIAGFDVTENNIDLVKLFYASMGNDLNLVNLND